MEVNFFDQKKGKNIYTICITGGPCAGKTTVMAELSQKLTSRGFDVFIVAEAATMMFKGGCNLDLSGKSTEYVLKF